MLLGSDVDCSKAMLSPCPIRYMKPCGMLQASDVQCSGTVKMLIDMELLAHADYLVASDRSRWSRILQYMRYILYGTP